MNYTQQAESTISNTGNTALRCLPANYLVDKALNSLLFLLLYIFMFPAHAGISVSPITASLDLAQKRSHLITVTNTGNKPVPVKASARIWELSIEGTDLRTNTDEMILYPGQFILEPGERRSVRAAPRDTSKPSIEKNYRILIQEVPVALDGKTRTRSGVSLLTSYATAFYLTPTNPYSSLNIISVVKGTDGLIFKLINKGNAHTHLRKLNLIFTQDDRVLTINQAEYLPRFLNENMLAGSERHFAWQWPDNISPKINMNQPFSVQMIISCEYCGGEQAVLNYLVP